MQIVIHNASNATLQIPALELDKAGNSIRTSFTVPPKFTGKLRSYRFLIEEFPKGVNIQWQEEEPQAVSPVAAKVFAADAQSSQVPVVQSKQPVSVPNRKED